MLGFKLKTFLETTITRNNYAYGYFASIGLVLYAKLYSMFFEGSNKEILKAINQIDGFKNGPTFLLS